MSVSFSAGPSFFRPQSSPFHLLHSWWERCLVHGHPKGSNRSLLGQSLWYVSSPRPAAINRFEKYLSTETDGKALLILLPLHPFTFRLHFFTQDHHIPLFISHLVSFQEGKLFSVPCAQASQATNPFQLRPGFSSYSLLGLSRLGCNGRNKKTLIILLKPNQGVADWHPPPGSITRHCPPPQPRGALPRPIRPSLSHLAIPVSHCPLIYLVRAPLQLSALSSHGVLSNQHTTHLSAQSSLLASPKV